jgi:hypothetical protein
MEHRVNVCVTVNGAAAVPDTLSFLREREEGSRDPIYDIPGAELQCFGELAGTQRILMLQNTAVIDSSVWFTLQTVDCCHGEAKTVDFVR